MSELQALPLALNTWGTFSVFSARQREEGERSTLSAEYESVRGSAVRQEHRSDNQPPLCFAPAPYPAPGTRKERMDNEGRTTASLGHLTLTEPRFVSNGDRESGLAAEQEDTLHTAQLLPQLLLKQRPNQRLQTPSGNNPISKIRITRGKEPTPK